MKKQLISLLLALCLAATMLFTGAMAEEVSADPFEEIKAEFAQAKTVDPYTVAVHPTRVTGWAFLRWAPSKSAPIMATYPAKQELTVLKETGNWLLVQNLQTGDVGYIDKAFATTEIERLQTAEQKLVTAVDGKQSLGVIDINGAFSLQCGLPEGYTIQPARSSSDQLVAVMTSEDPEKPQMLLSIAYDEAYANVDRMNDLDEEALAVLEKTFTDVDPTIEITYGDTGLGTRLMIARESDEGVEYLDFLSIYKGYFVEFVLYASPTAEQKALSEEQMYLAVDFLTDLDFVPVETESAEDLSKIADGSYIANLSNYDPAANTIHLDVMHALVLDPAEVAALKVGDTLTLGEFSEQIETMETDEDGEILINDDIALRNYGGEYHLYQYEEEYTELYMALTLPLPEDVVFTDWVEPETGEERENPVNYPVSELISKLESDELPGFASKTCWVSFDENGKIIAVERFYSPMQ